MTASVLSFRPTFDRHQCARCITEIPADRDLCYFHAKRVPPQPITSPHPECHVPTDLLPLFDLLVLPLTFDEIAERMGPGITRRVVDNGWGRIRGALGLDRGIGKGVERIALVRMASGSDGCFCRKS